MEITQDVKYNVVVRFQLGDFSDALNLTPEEYEKMSEEDIKTLQQARYDNWFAIVSAPSLPPTEDALKDQLDFKLREYDRLQTELKSVSQEDLDAAAERVGIDTPTLDVVKDDSGSLELEAKAEEPAPLEKA